MLKHFAELSPAELKNLETRKSRIIDYWNGLSVCDDAGGTTWDVLDELRTEVTELLARGSPGDIRQAEMLTAKAEFRRSGGSE